MYPIDRMGTMMECTTCGHDYDQAFTVTAADGTRGVFDSFECAIQAMAPRCAHCGTTIIGHGVAVNATMFCCSHCARATTDAAITDSVPARA